MPAVNYSQRAEGAYNRLLKDPKISSQNKFYFKEFVENYKYSAARKYIVFDKLRWFMLYSKDFKMEMYNKSSMKQILNKIHNEKLGYFETFRNIIPMFAKRMNDDEPVKPVIDAFKNFPIKANKRDLDANDMITLEDRDKLIGGTNSIQIRAIIATQRDAGFRPSELNDLDYGDVVRINPPYVWFKVRKGKTGPREVWIFRAVPHFLKWYHAHPTKKKDDPLWVQEYNTKGEIKRYRKPSIAKRIQELNCRKGGKVLVDKPLDFYSFRHSACYGAKMDNIPVEEAAKKFGHSVKFFIETYGRLDKNDVENRLAVAHNLVQTEKKQEMASVICKRCNFTNLPNSQNCDKCAYAISEEKKDEELSRLTGKMEKFQNQFDSINSFMEKLLKKNPEIVDMIAKEGPKFNSAKESG